MSIYSVMSRDVPTLAVVDWFAFPEGEKGNAALQRLLQEGAILQTESQAIQKQWSDHLAEITATSIQRMRGMLAQFLSTPLTSDNNEIQQILGDQVRYAADQLLSSAGYGIVGVVCARVFGDGQPSAPLKRLVDGGKRAVATAVGKRTLSGIQVIQRTTYVLGSANLDVIETLENVRRNAPGVETPVPSPGFRSLYELRMRRGGIIEPSALHQAVIVVDSSGVDAESLLASLSELEQGESPGQWSVWQNRFGSREYMFRFGGPDRHSVKEGVRRVLHSRVAEQLGSSLTRLGKLYFTELHVEKPASE